MFGSCQECTPIFSRQLTSSKFMTSNVRTFGYLPPPPMSLFSPWAVATSSHRPFARTYPPPARFDFNGPFFSTKRVKRQRESLAQKKSLAQLTQLWKWLLGLVGWIWPMGQHPRQPKTTSATMHKDIQRGQLEGRVEGGPVEPKEYGVIKNLQKCEIIILY